MGLAGAHFGLQVGEGVCPHSESGQAALILLAPGLPARVRHGQLGDSPRCLFAKQRVLLVDDLLATGGTALAAVELIEEAGGELQSVGFIVHLTGLEVGGA